MRLFAAIAVFFFCALLLIAPVAALAQTPWAGIINTNRAIDWRSAGATKPLMTPSPRARTEMYTTA